MIQRNRNNTPRQLMKFTIALLSQMGYNEKRCNFGKGVFFLLNVNQYMESIKDRENKESAEIYFDNSATTRPCAAALSAAFETMYCHWGNPSSTHARGTEAAAIISEARHAVAAALSADDKEITFTSGGTEANNLAIFGAAEKNKKLGNRIVTTAIEHSSVLDSVNELEKRGFEVIRLMPDSKGRISAEDVRSAITPDTILVSLMMVNNEVGSILPIETAVKTARRIAPRALVHCDCVQSFGKLPINVKRLGTDMVTVSAHKIHGIKGAGALWKAGAVHIPPRTFGGHQENGFRTGTEAVPTIAGFGKAAEWMGSRKSMNERLAYVKDLRDELWRGLSEIDNIVINSPEDGLPYILNFSTCCVKAETMLNFFSQHGIYVSSGSACAKGEPSHVLKALGLPREAADSAIRVSFCEDNTKDEIAVFLQVLKEGIDTLAHFR